MASPDGGSGPGAAPRARAVLAAVALVLLLVLAVQVSLQRIRSFDYWLHLRTGALIAETGSVPRTDPYTYSVPGAAWVDPVWLYQRGLHGVFSLGGHEAVVIAKAILVLAVLGLLAPIGWRRARPEITLVGLTLLVLVIADRVMPRPELPTYAVLAAELLLLDIWRRRGGLALWGIVPLQLLWVNLHGLFAVGLVLVGLTLAGELLDALRRWRPPDARRVGQLVAVLAASLGISLLNPHGLTGLLFPLQHILLLGTPGVREAAGIGAVELQSPLVVWRSIPPLALSLQIALGLFAASGLWLNRRRAHSADLLVLGAFGFLALLALRNVGLFAVAVAPLGVRSWNQFLADRTAPARRASGRIGVAVTALLALALAGAVADAARGRLFQRIGSVREPGLGVMRGLYPIQAAEWIARERPASPIFHHMADGGYLIWRLFPDYQVLLDGRLEQVFRGEDMHRLHRTTPDGFDDLDREFHFGTVLLHYSQFDLGALLRTLQRRPAWRLVFADGVAVVFTREPAARRWPALDVDAPDFLPPLEGPPGASDLADRLARSQLYGLLDRPALAREILAEAFERYPDDVPARFRRP